MAWPFSLVGNPWLHATVGHLVPLSMRQEQRVPSPNEAPSFNFRPEVRQDYPLNLSISISGGKETNQDSPSNGE
jgi:hypothetical protein